MIKINLKVLFIFLMLSVSVGVRAQQSSFFDQNNKLYANAGFNTRSLCGPVSFLNWLQLSRLQNQLPSLSYQQSIEILNAIKDDFSPLDQGLATDQMQAFLKIAMQKLNLNNLSVVSDQVTEENLLDPDPAFLLVHTYENPRPSRNPHGPGRFRPTHDPEAMLYSSIHYVLRSSADKETRRIFFVDPEAPETRSEVTLQKNIQQNSRHEWILGISSQKPSLVMQRSAGVPTLSTVIAIIKIKVTQ